jgi:hypothetical protein
MTAKVRSHVSVNGLRQFSQMPATPKGPPSRRENRVALPARIFLKKAVHRHDAAPPAVGVAKPLVLGDSFGAGMDRREIRTLLAKMRNEAPTQITFHRLPGPGVPPVDKLRFVWPSLLIHQACFGETTIPKAEGLGFVSARSYIAVVVMCWSLRHVLSTEGPCRPHGRPRTAGRVCLRETFYVEREGLEFVFRP